MAACRCEETTTTNACCRYQGSDIDCLGIKTGDLIESVITKITDALCNISTTDNNPESRIVKYSENIFTDESFTAGDNDVMDTSFTIPVTEAGFYEVLFNGYAKLIDNRPITLSIRINGIPYNQETNIRAQTATESSDLPFTLFASRIALNEGDVIKINCYTTDGNLAYIINAVYKLTKIS
jgi:hypothetical protein